MRWRVLGRLFFYPIFFLLLLSAILVSTELGSRVLVTPLDALVPHVSMSYKNGRLDPQLTLDYFQLDLGFLYIDIQEISVDWNPWCSLQQQLCLNDVQAKKLVVNLLPKQDDINASVTKQAPHLLQLPFAISLRNGFVEQGDLRIHSIQIDWQQAQLQADLHDDVVDIQQAHILSGAVHILNSSPPVTEEPKSSDWPLAHLPTIDLPLNLRLTDVQSGQFALTLSEQPTEQFKQVKLSGQWQRTDAVIEQLAFNHAHYGQLNLTGSSTLSHPYPLQLKIQAQPQGIPAFSVLKDSDWSLTLQGSMDELEVFAHENKRLGWDLTGKVALTSDKLPFAVVLAGEQMIWPDNNPPVLNYRQVNGQFSGDMDKHSFEFDATLSHVFEDQTIEANVQVKGKHSDQEVIIEKLVAKYPDRSGGLKGTASLNYKKSLSWQANLELDKILLPRFGLASAARLNGKVTHKGQYQNGQWAIHFTPMAVHGSYFDKPFKIAGDFNLTSELQGYFKQFKADFGDSHLTLHGKIGKQWQVNGDLRVDDLHSWLDTLKGSAHIKLQGTGSDEDPMISFQSEVTDLSFEQGRIQQANLTGSYQPKQDHKLAMALTIPRVRWQQFDLRELSASLHGNHAKHQLRLTSEGDIHSELSLSGKFNEASQRWQGLLEQAEIGSYGGYWNTQSDVKLVLDLASQQLGIAAHCWRSTHQSNICLQQEAQLGEKGLLELSLALESSDITPYLIPEKYQINGQLQGQAKASWSKESSPHIKATLNSERVVVNYNSLVEGLIEQIALNHLLLDVDINAQKSKLQVKIQTGQNDGINFLAEVDHQQKDLSGQLVIKNYQLGQFTKLFPDLNTMTGTVNSELLLSGQLAHPLLNGHLSIQHAKLELMANPTPIDELDFRLDFNGSHAQLLSQFKVGGGQTHLNGTLNWENELTATAQLKGQKLNVLLPPQSNLTLSPELTFTLEQGQPQLRGKIKIPKAEIIITKLADTGVALSKDVVYVDAFQTPPANNGSELDTRIQLELGKNIHVNAFGLTGRVMGNMDVVQNKGQAPQLFGSATFHDGKFAAYGQRLTIQENSSVHFNGDPEAANVEVRATRFIKNDNVTAGLILTGNLTHPKISFYSDPVMEQQEILSYIVRGRGFSDDTPANSMATAATVGVTAISSLGINKPLEMLPGISSVSLETEGEGNETQVTISGYVGERLYLKYGMGIFEPINEVTVRLYILNQLWLESVSGIEKSIDLYYSFMIE